MRRTLVPRLGTAGLTHRPQSLDQEVAATLQRRDGRLLAGDDLIEFMQ